MTNILAMVLSVLTSVEADFGVQAGAVWSPEANMPSITMNLAKVEPVTLSAEVRVWDIDVTAGKRDLNVDIFGVGAFLSHSSWVVTPELGAGVTFYEGEATPVVGGRLAFRPRYKAVQAKTWVGVNWSAEQRVTLGDVSGTLRESWTPEVGASIGFRW